MQLDCEGDRLMPSPDAPDTILELLNLAGRELTQVVGLLNSAEGSLWRASNLAVIEQRPSVQIDYLRGEIKTLNQIVGDTVLELIRKAAEVEAKSKG